MNWKAFLLLNLCNIIVTKISALGDKLCLPGARPEKREVNKCGLAGNMNIGPLMGCRNAEEPKSKKERAVNISRILMKINASRRRHVRS